MFFKQGSTRAYSNSFNSKLKESPFPWRSRTSDNLSA